MKYFENILFCDFGRFWASCCLLCRPVLASAESKRAWPLHSALTGLSLGHNARGFSAFLTPCGICFAERYRVPLELFISLCAAICSKTNSKSQEINL